VLEGGYSTKSGPISPLAQSVAHHVRALLRANGQILEGFLPAGSEQSTDQQRLSFDKNVYLKASKDERRLLKKRRNAFNQDMQPFGFHRVMTLRKRPRRDEGEQQQQTNEQASLNGQAKVE